MEPTLIPLATELGAVIFDRNANMPLRIKPLDSVEDAWKFLGWVSEGELCRADSLQQQRIRHEWDRARNARLCPVPTDHGPCGAYLAAGEGICECCAEDERLESMRRAV